MKTEKFKTKDFVLIGIITAIYTVIFFIVGVISNTLLPVIAYAFTQIAIALFFGGTIILFLIKQIPKFGVLSLFSLIFMLIFVLLGGGYLPWFLSTMITAAIADVLAATSRYQNKLKNAIAYGIMQLGYPLGGLIPMWFFTDNYRQAYMKRGMDLEKMENSIQLYMSYMGVVILLLTFIGGFLGIYVGYKILDKHFKERK